jgi:hypothetical protein
MCRNYYKHKRFTVEMHLCKHGFKEGYETWTEHGVMVARHDECENVTNVEGFDDTDRMDLMMSDLAAAHPPQTSDEPTAYAKAFYRMLAAELVHE